MSKYSENLYSILTNKYDYDLRKSNNGRWIDQKCTPDVLAFVVDCIQAHLDDCCCTEFNSKDIWMSDYARTYVQNIFKKVDPHSEKASNEYDKFFMQPMKMLANAGVLSENRRGNRIFFTVREKEILSLLKYESEALLFIVSYVRKVLKDSGIYDYFIQFFNKQNSESYLIVKNTFSTFMINNTKINGVVECNRIFSKVLNPLAFSLNLCGTQGGHISKDIIKKDELMYNRDNFRDVDKPKGMTRKEYSKIHPEDNFSCSVVNYMSHKAKEYVRLYNEKYNGGLPEIPAMEKSDSLQIHHIFMVSEHPELSYIKENLIALTPTQHLSKAHPNNNTKYVDVKYRCKCILNKLNTIKTDEEQNINQYDFAQFKEVLAIGFEDESFRNITDHDYESLESKIKNLCKITYGCVKADC